MRALISVSDKKGLIDFAKSLIQLGYEIISTGGTKSALEKENIPVKSISDVTLFPEILDGRVKTLHPNVHAGLLAKRDDKKHLETLKSLHIELIDLVVVNLYPFKETVKKNLDLAATIEMIDIGGPSMLRSAAKNYQSVTVVCDPNDYEKVIEEIKDYRDTQLETRMKLAAKVFRHTASYDAYIATYLTDKSGEDNPEKVILSFDAKQQLRYGENPHQKAHFYQTEKKSYSLAHAKQIQGKELSYNNIQDADACLQIVKEFNQPVFVAVKHMNPCGVGVGKDINEAWKKAYQADKVSIFGGIVGSNQKITKQVASQLAEIFLEVVLAPAYDDDALAILSKKKNLRVLTYDMDVEDTYHMKITSVTGGVLIQDENVKHATKEDLVCVTEKKPTDQEIDDLLFAEKVCKHVKSNAIVTAKGGMTLGVGAGQMNRIQSAKIALEWTKENHLGEGIVLASDAFFPFDDVVKLAADYGVTAIIQPGGSIKDQDSIDACNKLGIAMVFTHVRHFKH